MICFPNAKINIGLVNRGLRDDGYHEIRSTIYPISICDSLEIVRGGAGKKKLELLTTGIDMDGNDNLCVKAYEMLDLEFNLGSVQMHLHKVIPIGAGLGGGSADASNTILMLNEIFELGLTEDKMKSLSSQLGSDCPFFIGNEPAIVTGRGDELKKTELNLEGHFLVLVYPDIHINTAKAYKQIQSSKNSGSIDPLNANIENWRDSIYNDFEDFVFSSFPEIGKIKSELYNSGAVYASLSGSGSSVYGIFTRVTDLKAQFENHRVWNIPL